MSGTHWKKNNPAKKGRTKTSTTLGSTLGSTDGAGSNIDHLMGLSIAEKEAKLGELWKVFGMNSAAGKSLYKMFGNKYKKKIHYPKPKTKKWTPAMAKKKMMQKTNNGVKKCPQRTKVYYPPITTKQDIQRRKMMRNFNKLDILPKRRGKHAIQREMNIAQQEQRAYRPKEQGRNRSQMKEFLQDKFKYANDEKLKKKHFVDNEQQQKIDYMINAKLRSEALKKNTLLLPPEQKKPEDVSYAKPVEGFEENKKLSELNGLFDAVCEEIEERQNYLEEIESLGLAEDVEMKKNRIRIKKEITERVAELQKINKMIKIERQNASKN